MSEELDPQPEHGYEKFHNQRTGGKCHWNYYEIRQVFPCFLMEQERNLDSVIVTF